MSDKYFKNLFLTLKIWLVILPIAFVNGTLRVVFINHAIGEEAGHIVSTLLLSAAVVLVVYFFIRNKKLETESLLLLGFLLALFTVIFEFGLGLATGKTWEILLEDYNVFRGRIWPLVLLVELFSPIILQKIKKQ